MAVGSEFEALLLGPLLDAGETSPEPVAPEPRTELQLRLQDEPVEEPHVDVVEELREELDRQRRVHATLAQQRHGRRQHLEHVACGEKETTRETRGVAKETQTSLVHEHEHEQNSQQMNNQSGKVVFGGDRRSHAKSNTAKDTLVHDAQVTISGDGHPQTIQTVKSMLLEHAICPEFSCQASICTQQAHAHLQLYTISDVSIT